MIIEKPNPNLKLQRPSVIIDTVLDPKPKQPLPAKKWILCQYSRSGRFGQDFRDAIHGQVKGRVQKKIP